MLVASEVGPYGSLLSKLMWDCNDYRMLLGDVAWHMRTVLLLATWVCTAGGDGQVLLTQDVSAQHIAVLPLLCGAV